MLATSTPRAFGPPLPRPIAAGRVSKEPGNRKLIVTLAWATRARHAGEEAGQAGPGAARQIEPGERHLHRAGGDVDDAPEAPLDHAVDDPLHQLDRRRHVGDDAGEQRVAIDRAEVAERRAAIVVDEDVDLRHGADQGVLALRSRHRATTAITVAPVSARMSAAVRSSASASRPLTTTVQPARASSSAQARPSPLLEAQTTAVRPAMPRSISRSPFPARRGAPRRPDIPPPPLAARRRVSR